jgi:hypothetical protein
MLGYEMLIAAFVSGALMTLLVVYGFSEVRKPWR